MRRLTLCFVLLAGLLIAIPEAQAVGGGVVSVLQCKPGPQLQVDPIVAPGGAQSEHMHTFFGGRGINPVGTPTTVSGMQSGGTTCPLSGDTAGYWVPTLMRADGSVVPPISMNIYYRSPPGKTVRAFPEGFGLVCGSKPMPGCATTSSQGGGGWGCADTDSHPTIAAALPCPNHLIAHVQLNPSDTSLPKVTLHARWKVTSGSGYHISSDHGAAGGSTLHGDFWNTWRVSTLAAVIRTLNAGKACKGLSDQTIGCLV